MRTLLNRRLTELADAERGAMDDIVDTDRYPIVDRDSIAGRSLVAEVAATLEAEGLVRLPGLLRPQAVRELRREMRTTSRRVAVVKATRSAYAGDESLLALDDPRRLTSTWTAGHITRDMIPPWSVAQRLYTSPDLKAFIAACLGLSRVFEYADPLAGLITTVIPPGGEYGWHYDTNRFVITLAVDEADHGGVFEYSPDLRSPGDENLAGLRAVMTGDRSTVRSVPASPGDLQLFLGRYSLHRVTPVRGRRARLMLVLSYAEQPGIIGPVERTRQVYGRVTETHLLSADRELGTDGLIA